MVGVTQAMVAKIDRLTLLIQPCEIEVQERHAHARSVQRKFNRDWRDATGSDIDINTAFVAIFAVTSLLQQLAKSSARVSPNHQ